MQHPAQTGRRRLDRIRIPRSPDSAPAIPPWSLRRDSAKDRSYPRPMTLYVLLGGPRDGDTITGDVEPISSWATMHGRYVTDQPPQLTMTDDGPAIILRFIPQVSR